MSERFDIVPMKFLKVLREKRKLSAYAMAKELEILPQTYLYYENKAKGINIRTLCDIRKKLGLTWDELGKLLDKEQ